jgi:hypothetical protein
MTRHDAAAVRLHGLPAVGLLAIGLALVLAACGARPATAPAPELSALPAAGPQTQRLTFFHGDERRELIGILRHDSESLQMAMLSPQGQRLLTLVRDAEGARFLADAAFDPPFSAEWLASRLAWILWPEEALEEAFAGSSWALKVGSRGRTIYHRDREIARITGSAACRILDDLEGGYRLQIAAVSADDDDADRNEDACPAD